MTSSSFQQRQLLRRGIDGGHALRRSTCVCSCAYQLHARSCIFMAAAPHRAQRAQHLQRTSCYCSRIHRFALFLLAGHLSITLCITDMDDWAHHLLVNAVPLRLCNNQVQLLGSCQHQSYSGGRPLYNVITGCTAEGATSSHDCGQAAPEG